MSKKGGFVVAPFGAQPPAFGAPGPAFGAQPAAAAFGAPRNARNARPKFDQTCRIAIYDAARKKCREQLNAGGKCAIVESCKQYGYEDLKYHDTALKKDVPYWPVEDRFPPKHRAAIGEENIRAGSTCISKAIWAEHDKALRACDPANIPKYLSADVKLPPPLPFPAAARVASKPPSKLKLPTVKKSKAATAAKKTKAATAAKKTGGVVKSKAATGAKKSAKKLASVKKPASGVKKPASGVKK